MAVPFLVKIHVKERWSAPLISSENLKLREESLLLHNVSCPHAPFFFENTQAKERRNGELHFAAFGNGTSVSGSNEEEERLSLSPISPQVPFQNSPNLFLFFNYCPINLHHLAC